MNLNNKTPLESNQDAFNRACERLLGNFSTGRSSRSNACCYRLEGPPVVEGPQSVVNCCVLGFMMPDWPFIMPGGGENTAEIDNIVLYQQPAAEWFKQTDLALLCSLQKVHDEIDNWCSYWRMYNALHLVATEYDLELPEAYSNGEQSDVQQSHTA